jgi:glucose-1-phosphate cytidylyltransferase
MLLAGGFGTRLSELTDVVPKPLVRIGGIPIVVHIMAHYASFGHRDFIILGGYKHEMLTSYFLGEGSLLTEKKGWSIQVIDTGLNSTTAERIKRAEGLVFGEFMLTYGDGLCDVDVDLLLKSHHNSGRVGTVTAVRPPARFGSIEFESNVVTCFSEKEPSKHGWINGGFFCFKKELFNYLESIELSFESATLPSLVAKGELAVYPHEGFWHCMDTLRDMKDLEHLWNLGAKWNTSQIASVFPKLR